jgi:hypothetical protein
MLAGHFRGTIMPRRLVHMPDNEHGAPCPLGNARKGFEDGAYLVGAMHIHVNAKIGLQGVENQQARLCRGDSL